MKHKTLRYFKTRCQTNSPFYFFGFFNFQKTFYPCFNIVVSHHTRVSLFLVSIRRQVTISLQIVEDIVVLDETMKLEILSYLVIVAVSLLENISVSSLLS